MSGRKSKQQRKEAPSLEVVKTSKPKPTRSQQLPPAPDNFEIFYAACRKELKDIEPGDVVLAFEKLDGFAVVVQPVLDAIDRQRRMPQPGERTRRGTAPRFHALDAWRLEILRRVIGERSTEKTRDALTKDKLGKTRELLNFHLPRVHYGGKKRKWVEGIPSDSWMSDMRKLLTEDMLSQLIDQLVRWALLEKMRDVPGVWEESLALMADGSKVETHATPTKTKEGVVSNDYMKKSRKSGKMVPNITAPDAGFIPNNGSNADHSGPGWNCMFVMGAHGTVFAKRAVKMNSHEPTTLKEMVDELGQTLDHFGRSALRVLTADSAFHYSPLRKDLRNIGIVENISLSSHAKKKRSAKRSVAKRNKQVLTIDGFPNWTLNGHRELVCACAKRNIARKANLLPSGRVVVRTEGKCKTCGDICLTSGLWYKPKDVDKVFKVVDAVDHERVNWEVGNFFTFHDSVGDGFGMPRWHGQEGAFGSQFTQRFGLLKGKRWFYRQTQMDIELNVVVCITHVLSLERWRRMQAAGAQAPLTPQAPLAASQPALALAA